MDNISVDYIANTIKQLHGVTPKSINPFSIHDVIDSRFVDGKVQIKDHVLYDDRKMYFGDLSLKTIIEDETKDLINYGDIGVHDSNAGSPNFGRLYNWYAIYHYKNLANYGWHVPTKTELETVLTAITPLATLGAAKINDLNFWQSPNLSAGGAGGVNIKGSGKRDDQGVYSQLKQNAYLGVTTDYDVTVQYNLKFDYSLQTVSWIIQPKKTGVSVLLVKDSTSLTNGQTGTYTGNDGKVYPTVCVGTYEIMSQPLCETRFRDKTRIYNCPDANSWKANTTGAYCDYNNQISNTGTWTQVDDMNYSIINGLTYNNGTWAVLVSQDYLKSYGNRLICSSVQSKNVDEQKIDNQFMSSLRMAYCINPSDPYIWSKIITDFRGYVVALF